MNTIIVNESIAILRKAVSLKKGIVFSTSLGIEDQVITHLICRNSLPVEFFTLDTGRLFPETLNLIRETENTYQIKIKVYYPITEEVERYVSINGINGFYESKAQRLQCCEIRKVSSLKRALVGKNAWITGMRREQSENRSDLKEEEMDEVNNIRKFHPLINWKRDFMLRYVINEAIPINPLHHRGFNSIGCAPCTRPIKSYEKERDGRWWWENELEPKECGLHAK